MALLLRKIRKSKWYRNPGVPWLPEGDLQSDALDDLSTRDNQLSVFHVEDDESNLRRVIAAMAANCTFLCNIDFALLDQKVIGEIGIEIRGTEGDLPDDHVNTNWHHHLCELSASRRMTLAMSIPSRAKIRRIGCKKVLEFVAEAVMAGEISRERVKWETESDQVQLNVLLR